MIKKFFAFTLALLFVLNAVSVTAFADTKKPKGKKAAGSRQTNRLVALLPASDGVVFLDMQRLLNDALPQIFAASPENLNEINEHIDQIKTQTGFDVRQFEQIAVGFTFGQTATAKNTIEPVALVRGKYNSEALLTLAKIALKGKYREEKVGSKAVYIFAAREILNENKAKLTGNAPGKIVDFILRKMPAEIAVAAVDSNTLAIGSIARVRETFESKAKIGAELSAMVNRKPNSIMSFAAATPNGLRQFLNLDEDMLGQSLGSIRQLYGTVNVANGNVLASITAKSASAEQAKSLEEMLTGFQELGRSLLRNARGDDRKVAGRVVDSAKITRAGTDVSIDLQAANADIVLLIK